MRIVPDLTVKIGSGVELLGLLGLNVSVSYDPSYKMATWYFPPTQVNSNNQKMVQRIVIYITIFLSRDIRWWRRYGITDIWWLI